MTEKSKNVVSAALCASVGIGLIYFVTKYRRNIFNSFKTACDFRNPLKNQQIHIVNNFEECRDVVKRLKLHCKEYNVIGFDCEWINVGGKKRPVALLQLATYKGLCALIRLCNLKQIPPELRELLEDNDVIKVGVAPHDDATYLARDYGVCVASVIDLRFIAQLTNAKPEGLASLSKNLLNIELDKSWRIRCSDWEAKNLSEKQIDYAAKDAHVSIEIFKIMIDKISPKSFFWVNDRKKLNHMLLELDKFVDRKFSNKGSTTNNSKGMRKNIFEKQSIRGISTRTKPLYNNAYLQAPDGELLCTCDRKKAQWYIHKKLATIVTEEPFTVKLNFEPSGRAVGEVGLFYLQEKKNECVVCGKTDSYIRKNVVPREYRKLFPIVMKDHSSHDVVLLCTNCHQKSNMCDIQLREKLGIICNVPYSLSGQKYTEKSDIKKIRSAARALISYNQVIPEHRKNELRNIIYENYPNNELTVEFLTGLISIPILQQVEDYISHGQTVVDYYNKQNGGLIELERMWRKHFLDTMKPKFLPSLWSVNHNADRLEIRADEGRINLDDMLSAGLDPSLLKKSKNILNETEIVGVGFDELTHEYNSDDTDSLISQPSDSNLSDLEESDLPICS